jgi:hypothetical protein
MDIEKFLRLRQRLTRFLLGLLPDDPGDPYANVRVPKHRNPSGRTSSVAVEEPDQPCFSSAVSRPTR